MEDWEDKEDWEGRERRETEIRRQVAEGGGFIFLVILIFLFLSGLGVAADERRPAGRDKD